MGEDSVSLMRETGVTAIISKLMLSPIRRTLLNRQTVATGLLSVLVVLFTIAFKLGEGQLNSLWGDDYLVVDHFSSAGSVFDAIWAGLTETGQGKWRPLTYLAISVGSFIAGDNMVFWIVFSTIACSLLVCGVASSVFWMTNLLSPLHRTSISMITTVAVIVGLQPSLWYALGSPFSIMECGAAISCLFCIRSLAIFVLRKSNRRVPAVSAVVTSCVATLFHERFAVLIAACLIVGMFETLSYVARRISDEFRYEKVFDEHSLEPKGKAHCRNLSRSLTKPYPSLLLLWLSLCVFVFYATARTTIRGSVLVSSGGEIGLQNALGIWIFPRMFFSLLAAFSSRGDYLFFSSNDDWVWPANLGFLQIFDAVVFLALSLFLVKNFLTSASYMSRSNLDESSGLLLGRTSFMNLLRVFVGVAFLLLIPASLVPERIEPRWWIASRMILLVTVLAIALTPDSARGSLHFRSEERHCTGVSLRLLSLVLLTLTPFIGLRDFRYFTLPQAAVSSAVSTLRHSADVQQVSEISVRSEIWDASNLAWMFGYGGVLKSAMGREDVYISWNDRCFADREFCIVIDVDDVLSG